MVRLLAVIERDLKKFKRNPLVLAMSILMPIIYLLILGNSFQGKLLNLPLIVVNKDPGPHARRIVENLRALEAGPGTLVILTAKDENEPLKGSGKGDIRQRSLYPLTSVKRLI